MSIGLTGRLKVSDGSYSALTEISEPVKLTPPHYAVTKIETTNLQSTGRSKEYEPGLQDNSNVAFTCNFSKATYTRLRAIVAAATNYTWEFYHQATDTKWTFDGFLTKLETSFEADVKNTIECEICVDGAVTYS